MAYYLVRAKPKPERLAELHSRIEENAFVDLRPFGKALTYSLIEARTQPDGTAVWEEEDYCSPPLSQERAAVLDPKSGSSDRIRRTGRQIQVPKGLDFGASPEK